MIELRMSAGDLTQLRSAYSPVNEALTSLNMLYLGQVYPLHLGSDAGRSGRGGRDQMSWTEPTGLGMVPGHTGRGDDHQQFG